MSELCPGTMTFGEAWGWGATKEESKKMFDLFAGAGGDFLDTSVNYTDGESETILGARNMEQLQDNLSVLEWRLSHKQLQCLEEGSAIELGFPHGFLEGNRYIFGATFDQIDNRGR